MNKAMIIGRLGADPKLTYTQSNIPVCVMNVATDESYTDRDGNKVERTEWHRIVTMRKTAENCAKYLRKGSQIFIEGKLRTRKWTDKNGVERYITEVQADSVQFLDSARKEDGATGQARPQTPQQREEYDPLAVDEVPF